MSREKSKVGFVVCLLSSIPFLWASLCEANWSRTYGGTGDDRAYAVRQTTDGGYIVAGETESFGSGYDIWLVRLDPDGEVMWQKTYGSDKEEWTFFIHQTSDGGYVLAGGTDPLGTGSYDLWVLRLDGSGSVVWQKTYGGPANELIYSASETADGGYILAASTSSFGAGSDDIWLLKLNGSGAIEWQKTYGGAGREIPQTVQQCGDQGYVVAGWTESFGALDKDFWILKLDANGNVTWQKRYSGTAEDRPQAIRQTAPDGGYIVAGSTGSFSDAWLLKLDSAGNVAWQKTYGGGMGDVFESVQQIPGGGYMVAGRTGSFGAGDRDAWLLQLDSVGNVIWEKTYGGLGYDDVNAVEPTTDGGYVLAGDTRSFGSGRSDAWVMKLDASGSAGPCPFEGASTAAVSDTAATVVDTTAGVADTSASVADTAIVPVESNATSSEICPLSDNPMRLKVRARGKRQGAGTVQSAEGLIHCPDICEAGYNPGSSVTLSAVPSDLSALVAWKPTSLGCAAPGPCVVSMDRKRSVKAIFQGPNRLKVMTTLKNGGTGSVTSSDTLINCPGDCEENHKIGAPVTLTATPGIGSEFLKWTGRPCKGELTQTCTFSMDKNATVKAIFAVTNP